MAQRRQCRLEENEEEAHNKRENEAKETSMKA